MSFPAGTAIRPTSPGPTAGPAEETDSFTEQHRNYVNEHLVEQACIEALPGVVGAQDDPSLGAMPPGLIPSWLPRP